MPAMDDAAERAARSARELARRTGSDRHDVLLVLGSGLTGAAEVLGAGGDSLPLDTLPFFPRYTAAGHRAQGWSVDVAGKRVLVFGGRCHLYEGIEPDEAVHPLRTGVAAGCTTGQTGACACGDGGEGIRTCTDGIWGDCVGCGSQVWRGHNLDERILREQFGF
jgi:hypothetical protein